MTAPGRLKLLFRLRDKVRLRECDASRRCLRSVYAISPELVQEFSALSFTKRRDLFSKT
jgi:hypothetical protein